MSSSEIPSKLSVPSTLSKIDKPYNPKLIALLNDSIEFRVAKLKGPFVWHAHTTTDELFYIISGGPLCLKVRDKFGDSGSERDVVLEPGDILNVPKGVQHCPVADEEVSVLIAEAKGELNTGDLGVTERTVVVEDFRE